MADASAVVAALVHQGLDRQVLATAVIHAHHLLGVEVMSVFRRLSRAGTLAEGEVERCQAAAPGPECPIQLLPG